MDKDLETYIDKAIEAGACDSAILGISKLETIEDVLSQPDAPEWLCWYAMGVINGPFPEVEAVIAKDAEYATDYAICAIKGRFLAAEAAIARDAACSTLYAIYAIKGRFPAGESAIARNPLWAMKYNAFIQSLGDQE